MRLYRYVGPDVIAKAIDESRAGTLIASLTDLISWLETQADERAPDNTVTATFIINSEGLLLLAPRRSEHVACAGGGDVCSAGEITISQEGDIVDVTNQSTGYCPEPESWPAVANALKSLGVDYPNGFSISVVFRLCPQCHERNIVKDGWFECAICGSNLPQHWNFRTEG